jgi:large subunit ribosomal protein L17
MRHGKSFNHLGRTAPHRKAMLSNMASSLILHKRITTTVAKAKALKVFVEPLITKSKTDSTHSRRVVFSYLQDKESVKELFDEVSVKINDRPGGYTRIIKMGNRLGDNADMCIMELVDYNELLLADKEPSKTKTRRSRRGGKKTTDTAKKAAAEDSAVVTEAEVIEEEPAEVQKEEVKAADEAVTEVSNEAETESTEEPNDDTEEDSKKE